MSSAFIDPYEKARELNLEVIVPEPNQLFIDLDSDESRKRYEKSLALLRERFWFEEVSMTPSKTEGHFHAILKIPEVLMPMDKSTKLLFQACLGSDLSRELLAWIAVSEGITHPQTVFFEKK